MPGASWLVLHTQSDNMQTRTRMQSDSSGSSTMGSKGKRSDEDPIRSDSSTKGSKSNKLKTWTSTGHHASATSSHSSTKGVYVRALRCQLSRGAALLSAARQPNTRRNQARSWLIKRQKGERHRALRPTLRASACMYRCMYGTTLHALARR